MFRVQVSRFRVKGLGLFPQLGHIAYPERSKWPHMEVVGTQNIQVTVFGTCEPIICGYLDPYTLNIAI